MDEKEVVKKYGDVVLTFVSYYKYSFSYRGEADDGIRISASYGGDSGDIYRHKVENNEKHAVKDIINWARVYVFDPKTEKYLYKSPSYW